MTVRWLTHLILFSGALGTGCKDKAAPPATVPSPPAPATLPSPPVKDVGSTGAEPKPTENPALAAVNKMLVGTWADESGRVHTQVEFSSDGSYQVKERSGKGEPYTTASKDKASWKLIDEGSIQIYNVVDTRGKIEQLERTSHKIAKLSNTELELEGFGKFKRTK